MASPAAALPATRVLGDQFVAPVSVESADEIKFKQIHKFHIDRLISEIETAKDFPIKGVTFRDFFSLFSDPSTNEILGDLLKDYCEKVEFDRIAAYDSRGFPLAQILASKLHKGWVPLRKPNKRPGEAYSEEYQKEYGPDKLTLNKTGRTALREGERVLLIDDVIASGNTAVAGINLVKQAKAIPVLFVSIMDVPVLAGRQKVQQAGVPSFNLLNMPL